MLQRQGPFEVELSEPAFVADSLVVDAGNANGSYCPLPFDPSFSTDYVAIPAAIIALPENPLNSRSEQHGDMRNASSSELDGTQVAVGPLSSNATNNDNVVSLFGHTPKAPSISLREKPSATDYVGGRPPQRGSSNLPVRDYDCENYSTCLGLAAALDWSSFSCKGCSGCVNTRLLWRAHHRVRENKALQKLCNLPLLTRKD